MDVTRPYKFIGLGAMDVTKPHKFIGCWALDATKTYKFIGCGPMDVAKPYRFIGSRMYPQPPGPPRCRLTEGRSSHGCLDVVLQAPSPAERKSAQHHLLVASIPRNKNWNLSFGLFCLFPANTEKMPRGPIIMSCRGHLLV